MKKKITILVLIVLVLLAGTIAVASQIKKADGKPPIVKEIWGTDKK